MHVEKGRWSETDKYSNVKRVELLGGIKKEDYIEADEVREKSRNCGILETKGRKWH